MVPSRPRTVNRDDEIRAGREAEKSAHTGHPAHENAGHAGAMKNRFVRSRIGARIVEDQRVRIGAATHERRAREHCADLVGAEPPQVFALLRGAVAIGVVEYEQRFAIRRIGLVEVRSEIARAVTVSIEIEPVTVGMEARAARESERVLIHIECVRGEQPQHFGR